jgi:integrase
MARFALTDRFIHNVKPRERKRTEYFDETVRGLALRVSPEAKSWCFHYTAGEVRKRLTLGTYPATSLSRARTLASEARGHLEDGKDPSTVRAAAENTLRAICEDYLAREGPRLRSAQERQKTFERLVYPRLGTTQIDAIRRTDIVRLLDKIEDERGPVMADKVLAFLSKVFNWHASRSDEFRSPLVRGMARTRPKERARERILTDDEIRSIWRKAQGPFGLLLRFILLTTARRSEAAEMTWGEIDGEVWTLPAARNKTKIDLVRPLSTAALLVLAEARGGLSSSLMADAKGNTNSFIFTNSSKPMISAVWKHKLNFDKACGVTGWTIHDLRRTARSLMSRAGVNADIAERCLGHVIGGVRGIYDRHEYLEEKKRAFEALAAQIERIVNPQDNVVPLHG